MHPYSRFLADVWDSPVRPDDPDEVELLWTADGKMFQAVVWTGDTQYTLPLIPAGEA